MCFYLNKQTHLDAISYDDELPYWLWIPGRTVREELEYQSWRLGGIHRVLGHSVRYV